MCTVGNLWISESSLGLLEKFQRSLALPNIKYSCVVLFLVNCIGYLSLFQNISSRKQQCTISSIKQNCVLFTHGLVLNTCSLNHECTCARERGGAFSTDYLYPALCQLL